MWLVPSIRNLVTKFADADIQGKFFDVESDIPPNQPEDPFESSGFLVNDFPPSEMK